MSMEIVLIFLIPLAEGVKYVEQEIRGTAYTIPLLLCN